jgi:hypothetical protein
MAEKTSNSAYPVFNLARGEYLLFGDVFIRNILI